MVELITGLSVERVRANLKAVREEVAAAADRSRRDPAEVEILAACKYVPCEELPVLAAAGITLVGENRAQDLREKVDAHGNLFTWDFIGTLQSKHVRAIVPRVRLIHSLATESALLALARHAQLARTELEVLVEVNLAADPSKAGIAPEEIAPFIARSPLPVAGLMTMPPLAPHAERSRPWFRRLRELATDHGLRELSMGTTQDFPVAVEEGATIVRIGTRLYE
ncbi:MAG TPA: YggS family pyridoxal phosphate-dependent enzyme [Solirubrobacteraceae bacterium]